MSRALTTLSGSYPVTGISPSNPNLKAVTSQNSTLGVIFEPSNMFNVSVDPVLHQMLTNDIIPLKRPRR